MGSAIVSCLRKKSNSKEPLLDKLDRNYKDNFKEYFRLIKLKVRKFYEENQNNQFNISISLDKKDFNTISTAKKISLDPSQKFIYWKDYITDYLTKQTEKEIGTNWAEELLDKINNLVFLTENKWLSLFFWQEFELRTKPKHSAFNYTNKVPHRTSTNTNNVSSMERSRMSNVSDRFHCSFVSQTNSENFSITDPYNEYKDFRHKVKEYISLFNEHITNPEHPINIIAKSFITIFAKYINNLVLELRLMIKEEYNGSINDEYTNTFKTTLNKNKDSSNLNVADNANSKNQHNTNNTNSQDPIKIFIGDKHNNNNTNTSKFNQRIQNETEKVIKILQKFILKLQTSVRLMYSRTINYQYFIEEKDEFINLITSLIFKDSCLYDAIYSLFEISLQEEINVLRKKMIMLEDTKPYELGITDQFCLDYTTINFMRKMKVKMIKNPSDKKTKKEIEDKDVALLKKSLSEYASNGK